MRAALLLAFLAGCAPDVAEGNVTLVASQAPDGAADQVPVIARLEIECHGPGCVALVVCRDCDPAVEECAAWTGYCNLYEQQDQ